MHFPGKGETVNIHIIKIMSAIVNELYCNTVYGGGVKRAEEVIQNVLLTFIGMVK